MSSTNANTTRPIPKLVTNSQEIKQGFGMRMLSLIQRAGLARSLGIQFQGKRDLYNAFGWDTSITLAQIYQMYTRGGISQRIATAYPDSTWGRPPTLYIPNNDEWNNSFKRLAWETDLWAWLRRLDTLTKLGRFALLLVGTNRGNLQSPLPVNQGAAPIRITYLQPYTEMEVQIVEWEKNATSPRFGMPTMYKITPSTLQDFSDGHSYVSGGTISQPRPAQGFNVHYTRVIHAASGGLQSPLFGTPIYLPVWNYLTDLMKVLGSSSESYWRNAYQGLHANVDEEMDLAPEDEANLTAELDEYQHNMRRIIRTRGVELQPLGASVADPTGPFNVLLTVIAGTTGIPKRILLGSEAGSLASSQDKANWAERVEEYRELHAEPNILWPFVMWCINAKVLPAVPDISQIRALWPDAYRMSPLERGQTAAQTARSLANIMKGMEPVVIQRGTPPTPDTTGPDGQIIPGTPGTPDVTGDPIITREEARRIIGLSTDQNVLKERPEE